MKSYQVMKRSLLGLDGGSRAAPRGRVFSVLGTWNSRIPSVSDGEDGVVMLPPDLSYITNLSVNSGISKAPMSPVTSHQHLVITVCSQVTIRRVNSGLW